MTVMAAAGSFSVTIIHRPMGMQPEFLAILRVFWGPERPTYAQAAGGLMGLMAVVGKVERDTRLPGSASPLAVSAMSARCRRATEADKSGRSSAGTQEMRVSSMAADASCRSGASSGDGQRVDHVGAGRREVYTGSKRGALYFVGKLVGGAERAGAKAARRRKSDEVRSRARALPEQLSRFPGKQRGPYAGPRLVVQRAPRHSSPPPPPAAPLAPRPRPRLPPPTSPLLPPRRQSHPPGWYSPLPSTAPYRPRPRGAEGKKTSAVIFRNPKWEIKRPLTMGERWRRSARSRGEWARARTRRGGDDDEGEVAETRWGRDATLYGRWTAKEGEEWGVEVGTRKAKETRYRGAWTRTERETKLRRRRRYEEDEGAKRLSTLGPHPITQRQESHGARGRLRYQLNVGIAIRAIHGLAVLERESRHRITQLAAECISARRRAARERVGLEPSTRSSSPRRPRHVIAVVAVIVADVCVVADRMRVDFDGDVGVGGEVGTRRRRRRHVRATGTDWNEPGAEADVDGAILSRAGGQAEVVWRPAEIQMSASRNEEWGRKTERATEREGGERTSKMDSKEERGGLGRGGRERDGDKARRLTLLDPQRFTSGATRGRALVECVSRTRGRRADLAAVRDSNAARRRLGTKGKLGKEREGEAGEAGEEMNKTHSLSPSLKHLRYLEDPQETAIGAVFQACKWPFGWRKFDDMTRSSRRKAAMRAAEKARMESPAWIFLKLYGPELVNKLYARFCRSRSAFPGRTLLAPIPVTVPSVQIQRRIIFIFARTCYLIHSSTSAMALARLRGLIIDTHLSKLRLEFVRSREGRPTNFRHTGLQTDPTRCTALGTCTPGATEDWALSARILARMTRREVVLNHVAKPDQSYEGLRELLFGVR
ncbi:hypothetical protein C8R45DRAFT_1135274 [Mycena sanguinolenta]|nr:hypothetical protein C8R45DRAFT_1135274 [Mycena sanguinolenta]